MTPAQRLDIAYVRQAYAEHRPPWWKNTTSSKNVSFTATIWGRSFKANFMPSEMLGGQVVGLDESGRFQTIVTWQPHLVNSPKPIEGEVEEAHKLTEGDMAGAIVWHELGHNYVTQSLPTDQVKVLYTDYRLLFGALQEFYADMTALYHCTPQARKATMMIRVPGLSWNDVNDPHCRAAHAIGAWILAQVLSEPAKWPSFRMPPKTPKDEIERRTILYMYEHIEPSYSLAEDRHLRELVGQFIRTQGATVLKKKGTLTIAKGLDLKLMTAEDRELQTRRDTWVAAELTKGITSGAIKPGQSTTQSSQPKRGRIRIVIEPDAEE
jgi:hypothetical protein